MPKKPKTKWTYFFYNNQLHKKIRVNRGLDEIAAWNFETHKKMLYSWSAVQKYGERAITLPEASAILDRNQWTVYRYIEEGFIPSGHRAYSLKEESFGRPWQYFFTEAELQEARVAISQRHYGRPRKDKGVTARRVPSERDIRLAAQHRIFLYAKSPDGTDFIPVWESEEWE